MSWNHASHVNNQDCRKAYNADEVINGQHEQVLRIKDFLKDFYVSRGHSPLLEGLTAYRIVGNTSHSITNMHLEYNKKHR